jgi:hypothetical protein
VAVWRTRLPATTGQFLEATQTFPELGVLVAVTIRFARNLVHTED